MERKSHEAKRVKGYWLPLEHLELLLEGRHDPEFYPLLPIGARLKSAWVDYGSTTITLIYEGHNFREIRAGEQMECGHITLKERKDGPKLP